MKIAIFTDTFLPLVDGVVTSTLNLVKGLADRGHKIYLIIPKFKNPTFFKYPNVVVKRLVSFPAIFYPEFRFTLPFSLDVYKFLKKEKVDIIHFQTPLPLGFQAILCSKLLKVPLVGTFHTFFQHPHYLKHSGLDYNLFQKISWKYAREIYSKCNLITCPTEEMKKELLKGGFPKKIKPISNGIDSKIFDDSKKAKVKKKYNKDGPILLFVGRIGFEKNLLFLLDCFKLVLKKIPNAKLLLVGKGPQFKHVKKRIKKLKLSDSVIPIGGIKHEKFVKSSIINASDLFVSASLTETQGISILEAQANGVVCIGMDNGGVKTIIKDGYNGYLIKEGHEKEFAKKVSLLLTDKKKYAEMKKNTLKEIKKHLLKKVLDIWEEEYSKTISKYRPPKKSSLQ